MKYLKTYFLLISIFFSFLAIGQGSSFFGFKGKVFLEDDKGCEVTISLYDGNKKISSYVTGSSGRFIVDLYKNRHYTLQFAKEDYVTKRILIDTKVLNPSDAIGVKEFKFDVSLIKEDSELDYSELDFPIAIIEFENSQREFVYNVNYTNRMLGIQDQILRGERNVAEIR